MKNILDDVLDWVFILIMIVSLITFTHYVLKYHKEIQEKKDNYSRAIFVFIFIGVLLKIIIRSYSLIMIES